MFGTRMILAAGLTGLVFVQPARSQEPPQGNALDNHIYAKLGEAALKGSEPRQAYATFYRRLSLDLIGEPPSKQDVRQFLDADAKGRVKAIEGLVSESASIQHWTASDQQRIRAAMLESLLGLDQ